MNEKLNETLDVENNKTSSCSKEKMGWIVGVFVGLAVAIAIRTTGQENIGICTGSGICIGLPIGVAVGSIKGNKNSNKKNEIK